MHLCLIGAGEEHLAYQYTHTHAHAHSHSHSHSLTAAHTPPALHPSLAQAIAEHDASLSAVALFFQKKNFPHVSILEGGFFAAAKYLNRQASQVW